MKLLGIYIGSSAVSAFNPLVLVPGVRPTMRDNCQDFWYDLRGTNYNGDKQYTNSGHVCQKWSDTYPHDHSQRVPSGSENKYGGFCRNPGKESAKYMSVN